VDSARQPRARRWVGDPGWWFRGPGACSVVGTAKDCFLPATTRKPVCWICIGTPIRSWRPPLEARMRLAALGPAKGPDKALALSWPTTAPPSTLRALPACAPISPRPPAPQRALSRQAGWPPGGCDGALSAGTTHINRGAPPPVKLANLLGAPRRRAGPRSKPNMGDAWRETVVAVVTEFGRTARINGTNGNRSRHRHRRLPRRRCPARRTRGRRLARTEAQHSSMEERDLKTNHRSACRAQGVLLRDHLRVEESVLATPACFRAVPISRQRQVLLANQGGYHEATCHESCCSPFPASPWRPNSQPRPLPK